MGNKRGRRIVWRLLSDAGLFRTSYNTNALAMSFAEGNKQHGYKLLAQIDAICPEHYPTMVKEANDERNIANSID